MSGDKVGGEAAGRAGVKKEESVGHQHPEHPHSVPGGGRGAGTETEGQKPPRTTGSTVAKESFKEVRLTMVIAEGRGVPRSH